MPGKPNLDALDEELMLAIAAFDVKGVESAIDRGASVTHRRKRNGIPFGPMVTPALCARRLLDISKGNREIVRKFPSGVLRFLCKAYDDAVEESGKRKVNRAAKDISTLVLANEESRPSMDDMLKALHSGDKKKYVELMKQYKRSLKT